MKDEQTKAIQNRKTEGFVAFMKASGKSDEEIKSAHATYQGLDKNRQKKYQDLHATLVPAS